MMMQMGIAHVIAVRIVLTNTPKQVLMYEVLGDYVTRSKFAHLPMIMGEDGTKMSKRHGATAVTDYNRIRIPARCVGELFNASGVVSGE
ncbi:MAG: glutamate--tRNA ligase family protein [Arcicella sp.]|nr:glutamate--tRNA ligase family protein [Arcicella sp.]